jgi:hypothetical protein
MLMWVATSGRGGQHVGNAGLAGVLGSYLHDEELVSACITPHCKSAPTDRGKLILNC